MKPRERLLSAFHGELPDRLPWAPELNAMFVERILDEIPGPTPAPEDTYIEACRRLGAECLYSVQSVEVKYPNVEISNCREADLITTTWKTRRGTLTSRARMVTEIGTGMEFEHAIKTVEDIRAYECMYSDGVYSPRYDSARQHIEALGDAGVESIFGPPTPLLDLIMFQIRVGAIYYLMADYPDEMDSLLRTMHRRNCEYYEIAAAGPGEVVRPFEDTSTTLVSPTMFRRYCLPQLRDYGDICRAHGKLFVPHLCGLLRNVLPDLKAAGIDGIEALTPPPLGDTPFGLARQALGPQATLIGGINPTEYVGATPAKVRAMIQDVVDQYGDGRHAVLGHEEIHIRADFESVRAIPGILEEIASFH